MNAMTKSDAILGLDLGTVNCKLVVLGRDGECLLRRVLPGRGNPLGAASALLGEAASLLGRDARVVVGLTGAAASSLGDLAAVTVVNEVVAAAAGIHGAPPRTVIDLGGQFSKWILLDPEEGEPLARVEDFALNGACAAGAGAFLEQQASRLKMGLPELSALAAGAPRGATIAGRCSVFAKSDMIHLQQKGTPGDEIAYGLCLALARTFVATVLEGREIAAPVALVGGGASNPGLVRALREVLDLDEEELGVPDHHVYACAHGAALGARGGSPLVLGDLAEGLVPGHGGVDRGRHPPLSREDLDAPEASRSAAGEGRGPLAGHLGIDVGSVSTNVILLSEDLDLLEEVYVPTRGRPVDALDEALGMVEEALAGRPLEVLSVGATGSGRYLADRLVGADLVKNEITAQLASAARYIPDVDTVFEIGGQDSKFIDAPGGRLREFEMNKICAAGTGSFLEEQAERLGIQIVGEFGEAALRGAHPVDLGSRCTVFMDTELCHAMARDASVEDLCAGLAYSVARNYLEKVVDGREVGAVVVFQGGTSANAAVVAAFQQLLGRRIRVHPHGRVSGAIGAALLAAAEARQGPSRFLGFRCCSAHEISSFECKACENRCQVNRVQVGDRQAHFGDICERYSSRDQGAVSRGGEEGARPFPELFAARARLLEEHLPGPGQPGRPRVGLARASLSMEYLPFWAALLEDLDLEPVIAPLGSVLGRGKGVPGEVCLPLKIADGQVRHLLEVEGVERVLLPAVYELERRHGRDRPCTCIYAQHLADMARLGQGGKVLAPQLGISRDPRIRREGIAALAAALGASAKRVGRAWDHAMARQQAFTAARRRLGNEALAALEGDGVAVLGKPYNLHDPDANLGLARHLDRVGLSGIPMDLLPLDDEVLSEEWYMLAWQLNRDQVRAMQVAARTPGLYPIHVSSYGCGPDAFTVKHLERAWGRRPMLLLEFDEHQGEAGLVTRLEAFADEIASYRRSRAAMGPMRSPQARFNTGLPRRTRCVLPYTSAHVYPYAGALRAAGLETRLLPPPDAETLRLGEEVASGRECHPYSIIAGDLAKLSRTGDLEAGDRYFIPSTRLPCLLGQYGDGLRRVLEQLGEDRIQVFDQHPGEASALFGARGMVSLYEGLILVDYLITIGCLLRPREASPVDSVDQALTDCFELVERRGAEGSSARACLRRCLARLDQVPLEPARPRPVVGVTGDLYTRINAAGNGDLFRRLEDMGCTVWPSPFYGASSDFEIPQNARRSMDRGEVKKALKERTTAVLLKTCSSRLASVLEPGLRARCVEPPQAALQALAERYVGPHSSHLVRGIVAKLADFAQRGADGVISAIGLGCMVGVTAAAAIPAIRKDHDGIPMVSIAYGGVEGPAQRIQLETFVHQVIQRFNRNRAVDGPPTGASGSTP